MTRDELAQAFLSVGATQRHVSLGSLLHEPISVQDVPMQIPILGLLMAALIAIPILVSLLYRFWASLPFIAVVGFLAVMPWLAITLLISCIVASVRPFRTRFRFVSAFQFSSIEFYRKPKCFATAFRGAFRGRFAPNQVLPG